ncbi:MAG: hypothetical protein LBS45_08870, partial [Synergistaceae bacterium]|nr:hypothetical protein [Synergistaceae bacterium]
MKFHSRKTIYALFAVIAIIAAGTAWAVVSGSIITPDTTTANLNLITAYYESDPTPLYSTTGPFTVTSTTGTQSGSFILPTANVLHNIAADTDYVPYANQTALKGSSLL